MFRMKKWALEWKFEYKIFYSNKSRVVLRCVGDNCSLRMRATKLLVQIFLWLRNMCMSINVIQHIEIRTTHKHLQKAGTRFSYWKVKKFASDLE